MCHKFKHKNGTFQLEIIKCIKFDFGWGSASDPAWGAYSAPSDPLAGFKGLIILREGKGKRGEEYRHFLQYTLSTALYSNASVCDWLQKGNPYLCVIIFKVKKFGEIEFGEMDRAKVILPSKLELLGKPTAWQSSYSKIFYGPDCSEMTEISQHSTFFS